MKNLRHSKEDKSNAFFIKRFDFIPNIDILVEENKKIVLKQRIAAMHFNEYSNVAFHDLSRHKVETLTHNLTSLLGFGANSSHKGHEFHLKNQKKC